MKRAVLAGFYFSIVMSLMALTNENKVIREFNRFVEDKKYKTAYDYVKEHKDEISCSDYAILTCELMIDNFVMSTMHQMFALKDIPKQDDIIEHRGKEGSYEYILFDPVIILNEAIGDDSSNGELYFWLGEYYYEVLAKYNSQWLISNDELISKALENFEKSKQEGYGSYRLFGNMGQLQL